MRKVSDPFFALSFIEGAGQKCCCTFFYGLNMYSTHIFTSTDSTNRIALELAKGGAEHGTAVLAETQIKGRGRLNRSWHSPPQIGLYCSVIIRPQLRIEDYPKLTLVAGLSVAYALDRTCRCLTSVKWPNDIYISGRKLGGILTESSCSTNSAFSSFAVVGIGVNINNNKEDFEPGLENKATSILIETGVKSEIQDVFEAIRHELLQDVELFERKGFGRILIRWKTKDMLQGKMVCWVKQNGEYISGKAKGPDNEGRLIVQDEYGGKHEIVSGDVLLSSY